MNNSNIYTVEMSDFKAIDFFGNLNIENVGDSKTKETLIELVQELADIDAKGDASKQPNFTDLKLVFIAGRLMSNQSDSEVVEPISDSELAWNVYSSYLYFYNDEKNTSINGLDDFKQAIETYIFFMFHPNGDDDSIIDKLESLLEGVDLSNKNIPLFVKNALSKYADKDSTEDVVEDVEDEEFSFIPLSKEAQQFVPPMQLKTIKSNIEFNDVRERLNKVVSEMPMPYDTDGVKKKIAMLHYFSPSSDWYIIERDSSKEQHQAFGYTVLNGDYENAELGYISVEELKENENLGVELDIYFEPTLLSEVTDGMYDDSEEEEEEIKEDADVEIEEGVDEEVSEVESVQVKSLRNDIKDIEDMRRLYEEGSNEYEAISKDIKDIEDMIKILK